MSGQFRGWKYSLETWKHTILRDCDPSIYIHTWLHTGRREPVTGDHAARTFGGAFLLAYQKILSEFGYDYMCENYKNLISEVRFSGHVDVAELEARYETDHIVVDDETNGKFKDYSNLDKMHYKIWKCHEMVEKESDDFDFYLRLRPDLPIDFCSSFFHGKQLRET